MKLVAQADPAGAGENDNAVLVLVSLERGESARLDREAAHFEGCFGVGHEVEAGDRLPGSGKVFVLLGLYPLPITSLPTLNHVNITIAFRISPCFIA